MFYHFKGTITGEDYQRILGQMTKRMMLVFSGIMLIFLVINLLIDKDNGFGRLFLLYLFLF
ncbi:hypothetical protein ICE98_01383 [Lactococcus lactis]|nr:hypothetical protein [Lactococcus lactis]